MTRFQLRAKPDQPEALRKVKSHSQRPPDEDEVPLISQETTQEQNPNQDQIPKWQIAFVQAMVAMGQSPNPFLLSTITSY
jgi:hypothetical protein